MAAEASFLKKYEIADREQKVSMMLRFYSNFEDKIELERGTLEDRIKSQFVDRKYAGMEELGVRIQASSHGSPTESKAIANMEIEAALEAHDFGNIIFRNITGMDEIRRDLYTLEIMQMDFSIFKMQVRVLKPRERKVIEKIYLEGMDIESLAEEECIDYASIRQRLRRARVHLKENMNIFWDSTNRRAI